MRYDDVELSAARMAWDGTTTVRARITNTGRREAEEVVQLYIGNRRGQRHAAGARAR